jgi:hypothetical protein
MKKIDLALFSPREDVRARITEADAMLKSAADYNAALDRIDADDAASQLRSKELADERGALLTKRALEVDPKKVREFEPRLKAIAAAQADEAANFEAVGIARQSLLTALQEVEEQIADASRNSQGQMEGVHGQYVASLISQQIMDFVSLHALPLVLELDALYQATGSPQLRDWMNEFKVPDLVRPGQASPLLERSAVMLDGRRVALSEASLETPELAAMREAASEPKACGVKLRTYVKRANRSPAAPPVYYRRGWSTTGSAGDREADEARHAEKLARAAAAAPDAKA